MQRYDFFSRCVKFDYMYFFLCGGIGCGENVKVWVKFGVFAMGMWGRLREKRIVLNG